RRDAERGPEADARDRARPREPEPSAPHRRALQGAGADRRRAPHRGPRRDEAARDGAARRAELRHGGGARGRLLPPRRRADHPPRAYGLAGPGSRAKEALPRHMRTSKGGAAPFEEPPGREEARAKPAPGVEHRDREAK